MTHSKLLKRNCKACGAEILGIVFQSSSHYDWYELDDKLSCECYIEDAMYLGDVHTSMMDEGKADIRAKQNQANLLAKLIRKADLFIYNSIVPRYRMLLWKIENRIADAREARKVAYQLKRQQAIAKMWNELT